TPPQSWVEALPQYSTGNSIQITYSADDPGVSPSGVNEVELWYRVNGGSWINSGQTSTTATGSFAFNFLDWVDGLYEFATMATDAAANQESLPVTADASTTVNRQGPSVILATANPSPAGEGYVTITVTFDDGGNGLDYNIVPTVTYVIGTTTVNVSQSSYANNTWTGQALISSGMNGQATIRVRNFADLVGNLVSSDVSAGIFTIDTTPPVTNCSTNAPNPGITVTYAPAPVGEVTFEIRFTESSLNYSVSPTVIFYPKDSIIPIQVAEASYINNLWTGTALIPAGTPDGYATIVITGAADLAGNVMPACNAAKFIIDTVAPVSQATAASESGSSLRIDYTAQDLPTQESSGLDQVYLYYRVDVGDGFSEWKWTGLNNPGTTGTGHFIFSPINGDGVYEFYTLAIDKVKNVEVAPTVADVSYNYDKQGPRVRNVTVTPDPAGEGVVTFEIEFGEEANGLNYDVPVTVKFKPYGSNIYPQATQVSYENSIWTGTANILQSYTSGEAKIEISGAEDTLNNPMRQNSAYNFIIDTTAPKIDKLTDIQIIPQDGVDQKCSRVGEVTFVVAITENYLLDYEAPVAVTFYPANTPDPVEVIEYSYRNNVWTGKAVVTSDMENGEATVNITGITDLAGNVVQAHNKAHFCIDVVPPESAAIAAYPGNSIHIDYTARDLPTEEASDLKRVDLYYRVDVGDGFPEEYSWTGLDPKTASKGTFIFNPKNGDGVYEFYTLATDEAHNVEEAPDLADVSFIYDNKKPTVKSVTVTPDPTGAGEGEITFEIEFGNETNGLDYDIPVKVEFQPNGDLSNWYEVYQVAWGEEENIWTGKANILQSYNSGQAKIRINKAKDTLGNEMTENSSFRFTIDTDPPEVKVNSVTVNPNPAKAGQVLITVEFTEVHSVLDPTIDPEVYVLTHNGLKLVAKKTSFNNNKFTGRVEIPNQSGIDGPAAIWVSKATDSVGNEMPATNTNTFNIDVTLPTSHAFSKPYSGSSSLTISYQSSDPNQGTYASGVKSIDLYWRYSQDGEDFTDWVFYKQQTNNGTQGEFTYTALTEGTYEFYTLVTDVAGNTELPPVKADTKIIYELGNKDLPEVDWVKVNSQDTSLLPPVKNGYATITIKFKRNMDKVPLNYNILPSVTVTPYGAEPVKVEMSSYEEGTETWQGKLFINDHNSGEATINISGVTDVVGNIMRLDSVHTFFIDTLLPSSTVTHVPSYTKDSPIEVKFSSED
ncbi:hypothetical protein KJ693_11615, partial [bacterium]|nr:hypothetical protein [bacterium]